MPTSKRTKIVCTLGPSSHDAATVEAMARAGMNVARLNFSHGTYEDHGKLVALIRALAKKTGEPIAILQDLQGPKIRVGELPKAGVELVKDSTVIFSTDPAAAAPKIPVSYEKLHEDVRAGDRILLDDGLLEVAVTAVAGRDISCRVVVGGTLTSHKGFNLPTVTLTIPAITAKDREDAKFGVANGVDWIALSFVRGARDIEELRGIIASAGKGEVPKIIAKIEKHEALANIDEIIEAADGIMVARGDLGIETPAEDVPLAQKTIIRKCLAAAKPVIVATQMLDSMIRNPRPTRAEVSDVANAVIDHTDAVMLSGESASGKYPVEAVETMARIVIETEASSFDDMPPPERPHGVETGAKAIAVIAAILAVDVGAKAIVTASATGEGARLVSRCRAELPIYAATPSERVRNQLALSWSVAPRAIAKRKSAEELLEGCIKLLKKEKLLAKGDRIVAVAGESGEKNFAEVRVVA